MSDEAANNTSESEETREPAGEEKQSKPTRKSAPKKVVSRVRDAKSTSADREPKAAPVDGDGGGSNGDAPKEDAPREIPTVMEDAPAKEGRSSGGREERRKSGRGRRATKSSSSQARPEPVDAKELAKRAWKIYQSDVSEEGIALIDNNTGRALALRSFELARVFLEEKARQTRMNEPEKSKRSRSGSKKASKSGETPAEDPEERDDADRAPEENEES